MLGTDFFFFEEAVNLAKEAYENQEVPVGCVIVYNNEIIGKSGNQVNKTKNPTKHAELVAFYESEKWCIKNAKNLKQVLSESVFYVSLEPCIMCASALYQMRIKKLIYGACNLRFGGIKSVSNNKLYGHNHEIQIVHEVDVERCIGLLKKFYQRENPFAPEEKRKIKSN